MATKPKSLDKLDWGILKELQTNARVSASAIGREVGLTTPAVAMRIAKMEEAGVIEGYRTVLNYTKIGLPVCVFLNFKSTAIKHGEMVALVNKMPQIQEWHTVTGDNCMLLKVAVASTKELEDLLQYLGKFGDTNTSILLSGNHTPRIIGCQTNDL